MAILARDESGPKLAGQLLMCPMLDHRNNTPSAVQYDGIGIWDRASNAMGWNAYLGEISPLYTVLPYASPSLSASYAGLPPAFIDVGSADVFRDEDVNYASSLWAAAVQTELHVWPGGFHGFDAVAPDAALSRLARAARLDWLARNLDP